MAQKIKLTDTNNNFRMQPTGMFISVDVWRKEDPAIVFRYKKGLLDGSGNIEYNRHSDNSYQEFHLTGTTMNNFMAQTLATIQTNLGLTAGQMGALTFAEFLRRVADAHVVTRIAGATIEP